MSDNNNNSLVPASPQDLEKLRKEFEEQQKAFDTHAKTEQADLQRDLAKSKITTKNMRAIVNDTTMTGIILYHGRIKSYYKEQGLPKKGMRPDCSSPDGVTGRGDNAVLGKENKGIHACVDCPMAKFGTSQRGQGKGTACRTLRIIAFHRIDPRDVTTPAVEIVQIPPTGLRDFSDFLEKFLTKKKFFYEHQVTISLENEGETTARFEYQLGPELPSDMKLLAFGKHKEEKAGWEAFVSRMVEDGDEQEDRSMDNLQIQG